MIATKVGYDFVHHGEARGRGQREIPQDFSPEAVIRATDAALKRLKTDRIDLLQLHNIRMEQVYDDALWTTLEKLKSEGKVRYYGIALGPAIGWLYEGANCIRERDVTSVQHIYNVLEQHPGARYSRCGHRRRQGHNVSNSRDAFVWNARGKIHCRDNLSADRPSQPSAAQLVAEWN